MTDENAEGVQTATESGTEEKTLLTDKGEGNDDVKTGGEGDKEGKGDDAQGSDSDNKDADDDKGDGAPETYEDFKMPEGIEMDTAMMDKFAPMAKDLGLSQEKAQALVSLYSEQMQAQVKAQTDNYTEMVEGWAQDLKEDKEFGGDKFEENAAIARKAVKAYGSPELIKALDETGMGNHPEFVRFFHKVGLSVKEDGSTGSTGGAGGDKKDPAEILFGGSTTQK